MAKEKVTKEVFELMVEYYGKNQRGIEAIARVLSSDIESIRAAVSKLTKEKKAKANREKKKEIKRESLIKFANLLPCNACIWGQRVSDVKFYCTFGSCVKGKDLLNFDLKGA